MGSKRSGELIKKIEEVQQRVDQKTVDKLDLNQFKRIVKRLESFSTECEKCEKYLTDLENYFEHLLTQMKPFTKGDFKNHNETKNRINSHLQKTHHLITKNYYMTLYMSIGIAIGAPLGLTLFDNVALGMPLGMTLGIAIGTGLDNDAKKKGKMI